MAENPYEQYRNMLPSGVKVGEAPPEPSLADYAGVQSRPEDAIISTAADAPLQRVGKAITEGWQKAPTVVTPEFEASIPPSSGLGVNRPLITAGNAVLGAGSAALRGAQQAVVELTPDIKLPSLPPGVKIPLGGNRSLSGELTPGSLGREVAALPEAFPTAEGRGTVGIRPAAPQSYMDARAGANRGTFQVGATKEPPVTLDELTGAIRRTEPPANPPQPPPNGLAPGQPGNPPGAQATPAPSGPATAAAPASNEAILANAKSVADQHYGIARQSGQDAAYTPQSVGKMVDAVDSAAPQGPGERAVGGENAVTRLQRDMQPLRDQSLTLADIQRMDERMSDHITEAYRAGRNKEAKQLEDIQDKWREQADNATEADVTGGAAGFQALDPARKAWAQYRKMSDVMLMKERADMTQNPTTSYKTAVKNFVTSNKARGWTDAEKADLVASADRGVIGGTLHLLGSRLLPHVGGAVGASVGGIPGFISGEIVTHGLGAGARRVANEMQDRRVNRAMGTLGGSVPAPPTNELLLR